MSPQVWDRFQAGDEAAFRELIDAHSPRLLGLICRWLGDGDDAEDLLQEAWIRIHASRARCSGPGAFLGWAMVICRNLATDRIRSESARRHRQAAFSQQVERDATHFGHSLESGPDLEGLELRIAQEVLDLPELQRDVLLLRVVEGYSTKEAAERLGRATGTVKASLHRALATLRSKLQEWTP